MARRPRSAADGAAAAMVACGCVRAGMGAQVSEALGLAGIRSREWAIFQVRALGERVWREIGIGAGNRATWSEGGGVRPILSVGEAAEEGVAAAEAAAAVAAACASRVTAARCPRMRPWK
jgi:hypothetical protein